MDHAVFDLMLICGGVIVMMFATIVVVMYLDT